MEIIKTREALRTALKKIREGGSSVGFVPTMGALHQGHASLVEASKSENKVTVVSIFVNPTQFNDPNDLINYPRPIESDVLSLKRLGANILFLPDTTEMYSPNEVNWSLDLDGIDRILEGSSRPGHFQGVTQIVKKLFDAVGPDKAYFGQKDYQQYLVISRMVEKLSLPIALVACPIVREDDGLAMSSRNVHLKGDYRSQAPGIYRALLKAKEVFFNEGVEQALQAGEHHLARFPLLKMDYFKIVDASSLADVSSNGSGGSPIAVAAVYDGEVRLIDNVFIS